MRKLVTLKTKVRSTLLWIGLVVLSGAGTGAPAAEIDIQYSINNGSSSRSEGVFETNAPALVLDEEPSMFLESIAGVSVYADPEGSLTAFLRTGHPAPELDREDPVHILLGTFWEETFTKLSEEVPFNVTIGPWVLYINDGNGSDLNDNEVIWLLDVDVNGANQINGHFAIQGRGDGLELADFRVTDEGGTMEAGRMEYLLHVLNIPGGPPSVRTYGALYTIPKQATTLDLSGIEVGESFTVEYSLVMDGTSYGNESMAAADTKSPEQPDSSDLNFGLMMKYGDFGLPVTLLTPERLPDDTLGFTIDCKPDYFYILERSEGLDGAKVPVGMVSGGEGAGGLCLMIDPDPPSEATEGVFYSVRFYSIYSDHDTDDDGIPDSAELDHAGILDPLDPGDALEDADGDGRSNLREILDGTDPAIADSNPDSPGDLYPARIYDLTGPGDTATADLNHDGLADFVSFGLGGLQVVLGEPGESFLPPMTGSVLPSSWYTDLLLAHLDSDGHIDAAVVDTLGQTVVILLGQGDGRFQEHQTYAAAHGAQQVVTGDFNDDTRADLVVINENAKSLTILTSKGDGTYMTNASPTFDTRPMHAVLAHLNADTHADLAVSLSSSQVAILSGNGDGTFGTPQLFATGNNPRRIAVGDLNKDTILDLITSNSTSDDISIHRGNGDGTFGAETRIATGDNPRDIALADLNDDTHLDLVVAHASSDYHAVLLNDGTGMFPEVSKAFTGSGENALLTDLNGDGRLDLVAQVPGFGNMISHGLPGGQFETRSQIIIPGMSPTDMEAADINADGFVDILVSNQQSNVVEILLGQTDGNFALQNPLSVGEKMAGLATGTWDQGATLDLAVVTQRPDWSPGNSSNALHILLGDGAGGFVVNEAHDLPGQPTDVLVTDLNGDHQTDLLVVFKLAGNVLPFLGNGNGTFVAGGLVDVGEFLTDFKTGDFNQDDRTDLVVIKYTGGANTVAVFHSDAAGVLVASQTVTSAGIPIDLALADLTADNLIDLVVTESAGTVTLHPGLSNGTFDAGQTLVGVTLSDKLEFADVSGDGNLDVLSGGSIQRGNDQGGYDPEEAYWPGSASLPTLIVDVNGDQQPDLLSAGDISDAVYMLIHR